MKSFYERAQNCYAPEGDGGSGAPPSGAAPAADGANGAGAPAGSPPPPVATPPPAVTPPAASQNFRDYVNDDGSLKAGWTKVVGAPDAFEAKFTSVKSAFGSHGNLEKMISAKGVIKPGPNATPQEIDAYHAALGRPEKPDGYGLTKPETIKIDGKDVPVPNEAWDAAQLTKAQELFHRIGITKEQAAALAEFDIARGVNGQSKYAAAMEQVKADAIAELTKEWGPADGAKFKQAVQVATDAALKAGMTPEQMAANPQLTNDPTWIRMMHRVGNMIVEKSGAGIRDGGGAGANPSAQIAAIYADPQHPWHPANASKNPQAHREAVATMKRLHELKAGG